MESPSCRHGDWPGVPGSYGGTRARRDGCARGRRAGRARLLASGQSAFEPESYRPGQRARLVIHHHSPPHSWCRSSSQGPERIPTLTDIDLNGVPVTRERSLGGVSGRRIVSLAIRAWKSGLYFVPLRAADGRLGFAPLWSRPGTSDAIVWPSSPGSARARPPSAFGPTRQAGSSREPGARRSRRTSRTSTSVRSRLRWPSPLASSKARTRRS